MSSTAEWATTVYWLDGKRVESIPLPERGIEYGDGLFETLLYADGRLLYPQRHIQRLNLGLATLGFPDCQIAAHAALDHVCSELAPLKLAQAAVRLTVTRGAGPRGYAPPEPCQPTILVGVTPGHADWRQGAQAARLGIAAIRLAAQSQLAGIKHLNRLEQVLAARERVAAGCDEMLMLDASENIVCAISGNVFAVVGDTIVTPAIQTCGVLGTRRALLLESWGPKLGRRVVEQTLDMDMLLGADEVFYSNALLGVRAVASVAGSHWSKHPVCEALRQIYLGENIRSESGQGNSA